MMSLVSTPQLVFGSTSFGDKFVDTEQVQSLLDVLSSYGIKVLDTAGRYPSFSPGQSEKLIGDTKAVQQGFVVDTKILSIASDHKEDLSKANIEKSLDDSLGRLKVSQVNTLHIHWPDPETPIEEQARALNELYQHGKFRQLGVSNFNPSELQDFLDTCDEHNFIKPTVYQGNYSLVNRGMEKHLLPILRKHGIVFNAFSVIASGFLSGSLTQGSTDGTRFGGQNWTAQFMMSKYDHESLHAAQRKLSAAIENLGMTPVEAALRWAAHNSVLQEGDGIIMGASKTSQIISNVEAISRGPLPDDVVNVIEDIWNDLKVERENMYVGWSGGLREQPI